MKNKKIMTVLITGTITTMLSFTAFAGSWQSDANGWWWQNDDGTYPANSWQWLDGNGDGIAECYYFDGNGYMLKNQITPDGYWVNADGAWVENGEVKTQVVQRNIEISQYLETYKQLVDKLNMHTADWWQFAGSGCSYMIDNFYLEYMDDIFSMKNEGASYVKLYGISLGDSESYAETILEQNGWVKYYSNEREATYVTILGSGSYILCMYKDSSGNISSWYLNNWPEGADMSEAFAPLLQNVSQRTVIEKEYEYANGEFLSNFHIENIDGEKQAFLSFWHNYGASSSDEDFNFEWIDGKWKYEVQGNRSNQNCILEFEPTNTGMKIKVTWKSGKGYSWLSGDPKSTEWSNAEYGEI